MNSQRTYNLHSNALFSSLVPDVLEDDDSPTSSKSDGDDGCDNNTSSAPGSGPSSLGLGAGMQMIVGNTQHGGSLMNADNNNLVIDDNNWNGILRFRPSSAQQNPQQSHYLQHDSSSHRGPLPPHCWIPTGERRRRRLPEIPKSKRGWPPHIHNLYAENCIQKFCIMFRFLQLNISIILITIGYSYIFENGFWF